MYESIIVVLSAGILGFCVGMLTILMVTVQFYQFLELNWVIEFPLFLFIGMFVVSILTTVFSVYIPMRKLNARPIAVALKG